MEKEGEIKIGTEERRKEEERVEIKDGGEASSVHNLHVIELIDTNTVFHFPSFVAHLGGKILIKCINKIILDIKKFHGFN